MLPEEFHEASARRIQRPAEHYGRGKSEPVNETSRARINSVRSAGSRACTSRFFKQALAD